MSFSPGSLDWTDLSPNAGILGTQIADGTIQLRNLAPAAITGGTNGGLALATITNDNLVAGTIQATSIAGDTITGNQIFSLYILGKTIQADTGTIGGWTLNSTTLTGGAATLDSVGILSLGSGNNIAIIDSNDNTYRLVIGNSTYGSAPFRVDKLGNLTATSATLTGTVTSSNLTATGGTVGGWTLGATALTAGSGSTTVGLDSGGVNPAFYAGSSTPSSAPFQVSQAGAITATSGSVGGWNLSSTALTGPTNAVIKAGQTDFNVGTGFWLGNPFGTPKFSIGTQGGNSMRWDGTNLIVTGAFTASTVMQTFVYTAANLPVPPTTVGYNSPSGDE